MNKIKLTTTQILVAAVLLCGLMAIQIKSAPTLRANGKIAFTSDRDGNSEIYLMNADGSGQTRLTNNSVRDDYPTWSPDGRTIAFVRQNGSTYSINLMNADGTNNRQITTVNVDSSTGELGLSWSPDGTKIAFVDSTDIYTINVDGSNRINLTNGQSINFEPSWSPDGSRIAFARYGAVPENYGEIYTMTSNGSDVRKITTSPHGYTGGSHSPDWSPDGERIALSMPGDELDADHIALINPDGTNLRFILYDSFVFYISHPKWSPDGTKIVFNGSDFTTNVSQIWAVNRDGSGLMQLTNSSPNNFHPDWQPLIPESGLIVTRSDDRNAVCTPGDCSLREAVNAANASATDDTINFASGLTRITLTNDIVINDAGALAINGTGANVLTIDGGAGTNRIFYTKQATVTISGVTLTGGNGTGSLNGADYVYGGAIFANGGSLTLDGVHVTGNRLVNSIYGDDGEGGGVIFVGGIQHRIINSTISGNSAGYGGGFAKSFSNLTVVNSTISGNTATRSSGGGFLTSGYTTLRNVTITNNIGGGFRQVCASRFGGNDFDWSFVDFGNTIVAGNTATFSPEISFDVSGCDFTDITSAGGNLVGDSPGDSTNTGSPIAYQPTDIRDTNPMLSALVNNGGSTPTHALLAGSPAIDKGINLVSPIAPVFDQRGAGFARIRDGNGDGTATVDIGAFEVQLGATAARTTRFDFDGDGRADLSVFRSSDRTWYLNRSQAGFSAVQFGLATDKLVPADYDGDGKTDIAVFRDGFWYWLNSSNNQFNAVQFGQAGDVPVPADYDGDGRAELAVFRSGFWHTLNLAANQFQSTQFGQASDKPVAADYDGDGKADIAVVRQSGGLSIWYILGSSRGFYGFQFGTDTDKLVPADYDGDGKTDFAVFRPSDGNWYIWRSSTNSLQTVSWGLASDAFVPADYDGDGKADIAVYRNGTWYIRQTSSGINYSYFGSGGDVPTNQVQ